MNMQNLPYGAREIVELRCAGKRPADMILVSIIGPLRELNPVIVAKAGRAYDWRVLVGLPVAIVVKTETPDIASIVKAIEAANPSSLAVWFADRQDGVNVLIEGHRPTNKNGRRIALGQRAAWAGLGSERSTHECLALIAGQAKRLAMENAERLDPAQVEMAQAGLRQIFGKEWESA